MLDQIQTFSIYYNNIYLPFRGALAVMGGGGLMLYLYLGYILAQSYAVVEKLVVSNITPLAMFFSVVVFFIWSTFPVAGYAVAKAFSAKGQLTHKTLLIAGLSLGLLENILFHFNILSYGQETQGTLIVFCLSFALAYLTFNKPAPKPLTHS